MKTAKLAIGIVSIVLFMIVIFQSCAAGFVNAVGSNTSDHSGAAGLFTALLILVAGIVGIVARDSKGGAIAATIVYAVAGIIGIASNGVYEDLIVWGFISLIFGGVFAISIFVQDYSEDSKSVKR